MDLLKATLLTVCILIIRCTTAQFCSQIEGLTRCEYEFNGTKQVPDVKEECEKFSNSCCWNETEKKCLSTTMPQCEYVDDDNSTANNCHEIKGLARCEYADGDGIKYVPDNKTDCEKFSNCCCWNEEDKKCRPKRPKIDKTDSEDGNPFSQPEGKDVKAKLEKKKEKKEGEKARFLGLSPRFKEKCIDPKPLPFPSGCRYTKDEPYVLDPPTDIPYCLRIPCELDNAQQRVLDGSHFKCGSTPGCYFDVELFEYRQAFGPAVLPGVPVCHLAIRNAVFLQKAREVVSELGSWNPYFTNCLLKTFSDEIYADADGCDLIPLMTAFGFYPKLAGWDTITSQECKLIGACWSATHGCRYPVDINNLIVKSGQRYIFNQFDVVYGRPKCQHFNTENPYETLKSYHRCLASGCTVDISVSGQYYQYLFDIGQQMSVRDHWYYWAAVIKGDIGPFNLDTDIYWPYDTTFSGRRSLGGGGSDPSPSEPPSEEPDDGNPFTAGLFGRGKRQVGFGSSACGFAFKAQGYRPCRPTKPPTLKPDTHCPYKRFSVPRFKPLKGSFYGCCEINLCYISRRDIRKMHSGPSVYYTEWSEWGACSSRCGRPGTQTRTRKCVSHDKDLCTLEVEQNQPCGGPCNNYGPWGRWTPCPSGYVFPCPITQRFRVCRPDPNGCEGQGPTEQTKRCPCRRDPFAG